MLNYQKLFFFLVTTNRVNWQELSLFLTKANDRIAFINWSNPLFSFVADNKLFKLTWVICFFFWLWSMTICFNQLKLSFLWLVVWLTRIINFSDHSRWLIAGNFAVFRGLRWADRSKSYVASFTYQCLIDTKVQNQFSASILFVQKHSVMNFQPTKSL